MIVPERDRFTKARPCPICGGYREQPQGKGVRCYGYLDSTGEYARCTREEYAGEIALNEDGSYSHRLHGDCRCGRQHGPQHLPDAKAGAIVHTTVYEIRDADGNLLAEHVRRDMGDGSKRFSWRSDGSSGLGGHKTVDLLYGIEHVKAHPEASSAVLVEGEKAADALRKARIRIPLGMVCGAPNAPSVAALAPLKDKALVIWADNDADGRKAASRARQNALEAGCASVLEVQWEDAPPKADAADALAIGGVELVRDLIKHAIEWQEKPDLKVVEAEAGLRMYTLPELRNMSDLNADWVVDRFLAVGAVTHLIAYIKAGKTTLSLGLISSVLHGTPFLDEFESQQGAVVLLTEERPGSLLLACEDAGITDDDNLRVLLRDEHDGDEWGPLIAQAANAARDMGARLLVVDTFYEWAGVDDENDAAQVRRAMDAVNANSRGLAILLVMHSRKSGGEIHNAARGSSAAGGAADILLHLDYVRDEKGKAQEDSPARIVSIKSRLERDFIDPVNLVYEYGRYVLTERVFSANNQTTVLADIQANGPSRPRDIQRRTGINDATVRTSLSRLKLSGEIVHENGRYVSVSSDRFTPFHETDIVRDGQKTAFHCPPSKEGSGNGETDDEAGTVSPPASAGAPARRDGAVASAYKPGSKCPMCGERAVEERAGGALVCHGCKRIRKHPDDPSPR